MRILVVTQHYHPETMATGRRARELAEDFAAAGHSVTVLAGQPNHPTSAARGLSHLPKRERLGPRLGLLRVPVLARAGAGPTRRLLTYATFGASTVLRGALARRDFDAVVAISPLPTGLAAALIAAVKRAPLVFDLQDIWPESAAIAGVMATGRAYRALERLEQELYGRATAITVITRGFAARLVAGGIPAEKVHYIPNGVDVGFFERSSINDGLRREYCVGDGFTVLFAGNMGLMQDLDTVLDAAKTLAGKRPEVRFVLVGDGVRRPHLEQRIAAEAITNVRLLPPQARGVIPDLLFLADAALVSLIDRPLFEITVPSKTYECMAAARPILCGVKGETAALVAEAGCGIAYEPGDPQSLGEAVGAMQAAERRALGTSGRRWVEANATRAMVSRAYLDVVESVVR